jgi:hypothetical protein
MKKILFCLGMGALMLLNSCTKEDKGALNANTWSVSGKVFTAAAVDVSASGAYISGADGKGSSLDVAFKSLPSSGRDFTVNDAPYTTDDVSVRTILSGSLVYNSIANTGAFVSVRKDNGGKYTVIMNDVKLVNAAYPHDTVRVSSNLVQP